MNLDDQLRAVLSQEAEMTSSTRPPDIDGLIGGGQSRRRKRNAARAGIAVLAVAAVAGGAYGVTQIGSDDPHTAPQIANGSSSTADASGSTGPVDGSLPSAGAIEPGTYQVPGPTERSVADFSITFPEGWTTLDGGLAYSAVTDQGGEIALYPFVVDHIYSDACVGNKPSQEGEPVPVGPGTDALITALRDQGHGAAVSEPVRTTLGNRPATRIDLTIPAGMDVSSCRVPGALQIWRNGEDGWLAFTRDSGVHGGEHQLYILDVDGERQVFDVEVDKASAADRAELQQVLDSIELD